MNNPIALMSEREEDFVFAAEVAKQCDTDLILITDPKKIIELMENKTPVQCVFAEFQSKEAIQSFELITKEHLNRNLVHALIAPNDPGLAVEMFESRAIGNFVFNKFSNAISDAQHYARIVRVNGKELMGLRSFVESPDKVQTIRLTDSTQKSFAANAIAIQLREFQCNERIARTVAGAVDELLMNAIFDAPIDNRGQRLHDQTPRSERLDVKGVELQVAVEDNLIAVTVVDEVGSLSRDEVLAHIAKIFDSRFQKIRGPDYQGSGIGLSLVMKSGGSLSFVTVPGKRTEVTVFFRQTEKFKDFKSPFQFVSTRVG